MRVIFFIFLDVRISSWNSSEGILVYRIMVVTSTLRTTPHSDIESPVEDAMADSTLGSESGEFTCISCDSKCRDVD